MAVFPDGQKYKAVCTAISSNVDLALLDIDGVDDLPFARLARAPPEVGTWICVIGQPGSTTPDGDPTGYEPFHVSTGRIRGFRNKNDAGPKLLGVTKHDAWTYWGHSGVSNFQSRRGNRRCAQ